ncbi:sulfatase-like hydrolase/transferase [Auraticoccus monumenti]|uniref:Arylsulfatase A n=1 Tax=Auraticoccus monumenti TaxID=675864 RepID=A0A1G6T6R8_9ACTN|nr:sulfatase-like hydrolase/transferase [Auraticoccus monumenti]SDD24663.1 Arylsulfatase A [Auraticoccus monumenti]
MSHNPDARRPNVVVFFTDQQRWDTLGAAGNPAGLTPNLDQMSRRGTMFEVACTPNPVCAPARAALQTGRYPTGAGVHRNGLTLDPSLPTLGRVFRDAGYRTGYIGKWHLSEHNPVPAQERDGYEHWLGSNTLEFTSDEYKTIVYDGDDAPVQLVGYRADALTDAAIRFLSAEDDRPFMLFVSLIEPHHQNELDTYPAPEVYRDCYTGAWMPPDLAALPGTAHKHLAGYYGQVKRLDECLGRLRDALVSLEVADETVLVYTSDHGSHFKTRNGEYKRSAHDGSIRVPLLVEGPGFRGGRRVRTPVSTVDLVPTLYAASGLEPPEGMDGQPLQPVVDADDGDASVLVQISESEVGRALRTRRWKYHVSAPETGQPAADRYTEVELYDLDSDPYELENLIDDGAHRPVVEELRHKLVDMVEVVEGVRPTVEAAPVVQRAQRRPQTDVRRLGLTGRRGEYAPAPSGQ